MSMVAGTIVMINDGMPLYLVKYVGEIASFLTVKMHKHAGDTALGTLLRAMQKDFDINNLRLDELDSINVDNQIGSLYVFNIVEPIEMLPNNGYKFVEASSLHSLLETVDMSSAPKLL
ncbi:hypothetical protein [Periweissella fabalis]|uniref:Uncharacterized protein n=1 Tax=Periweissella fabalis TaxID=1070421 RepID=A0A7X6N1S0_9LACO|nr:hypothetical protein [Periweissella fabalis]MCM0598598.1 hypothetical protein [Periweissella fabalis]NKZ24251.1 hypothetical protein [Periweissella fabalis]